MMKTVPGRHHDSPARLFQFREGVKANSALSRLTTAAKVAGNQDFIFSIGPTSLPKPLCT